MSRRTYRSRLIVFSETSNNVARFGTFTWSFTWTFTWTFAWTFAWSFIVPFFILSWYALAVERLTFFASKYFFYCHILLIIPFAELSLLLPPEIVSLVGTQSKRGHSYQH